MRLRKALLREARLWVANAPGSGRAGPAFTHRVDIGGRFVAKIIEFYVPSTFRKSGKWVPPEERGKIIEFVPETKKTA
jgi:hypothetical protein